MTSDLIAVATDPAGAGETELAQNTVPFLDIFISPLPYVDDVDVVIPVSYWNGDTELNGKSGRRKRNELRMQLIGFYRFYCLGEAVSR